MELSAKSFNRFVQGYSDGFEELFDQYYKILVSFSMRYGVSQAEAEDISMETFHKIWGMRDKIASPSSLNSLLFISVKNKTLNAIRDKKTISFSGTHDVSFFEDIVEEDLFNSLSKAISVLSKQMKDVIYHTIEGKKISEISNLMKISESSVKTYKGRAIRILKDKISNRYILIMI